MDSVKFRLDGVAPLIMHNSRGADPLNEYAKRLKEVTKKRKKSDEDQMAMSEIEWESGLYWDDKIGPYIPGINILSAIWEAAKLSKQGKEAKRSFMVVEPKCRLEYQGPRDLVGLWKAGFKDVRLMRVQMTKVRRTRPSFNEWACEFTLAFDDSIWNRADVVTLVATCGRYIGLLDGRPVTGRFQSKEVG